MKFSLHPSNCENLFDFMKDSKNTSVVHHTVRKYVARMRHIIALVKFEASGDIKLEIITKRSHTLHLGGTYIL